MKVPSSLVSLTTRAVAESMDVNVMTHVAKEIIPDYDLHERTGFRESMVIPQGTAARQIVTVMVKSGLFLYFITMLIQFHTIGWRGRVYPILHLKEIIREINEAGYIYDPDNKLFVEDPTRHKTRNWGVLVPGREYLLAFLRLDIVGNSQLVRKYPEDLIESTYADVRRIVEKAVDKRNGRIWSWEGDGGLIAFYFGSKILMAALSGMEIVNELFMYNMLHCRLPEPIRARVAAHAGIIEYSADVEELMKNDPIKETIQIESKFTKPNTLTISTTISSKLEGTIVKGLEPIKEDGRINYYAYSINLEQ